MLERERETYEAIWALDAYRAHSPGEAYLSLFLGMAATSLNESVLDAGCGSGKGAIALSAAGFDVMLCDLTAAGLVEDARRFPFREACLWMPLGQQLGQHGQYFGERFDWVYCCDVLEHIPTPFTMLVVARLLEVARRGVFLSISLMPDAFGAWVGKPLHQTVQTFVQWKEQLAAIGHVREARDLLHCGVYLVEP